MSLCTYVSSIGVNAIYIALKYQLFLSGWYIIETYDSLMKQLLQQAQTSFSLLYRLSFKHIN